MATLASHFNDWPGLAVSDRMDMAPEREQIAQVIAWIEQVGERDAWPPKALFALTLCADEALINTVSYAQPQNGQVLHIALALGRTDYGFALCITENGVAFDPTQQQSGELALSLDDAELGGHGLRLIRHYLHAFEYRRIGDFNQMLLGVASGL